MEKDFLLQMRAREILRPFKIDQNAPVQLIKAYTERWRTYHNHLHIWQMLELADTLDQSKKTRQRLNLLILYHDVWYKVLRTRGYNELCSIEWALADISTSQGFGPTELKRTRQVLRQGIIATIDHSLDKVDPDYVPEVALLLDLDLWILGQDYALFHKYNENVYGEYQPIFSREEFMTGRADWARSFLKRPKIYHTEKFLHLEEKARQNLSRLINPVEHTKGAST